MTDEQKRLIMKYLEKEELEYPDMAPTQKDLKNPVTTLKEIPLKQELIPKAVSWDYFWNTGIITIINNIITAFGFGLCAQRDLDGNVISVYPARTSSRGLSELSTNIGLEHFGRFMAENASILYNESYVAEKTLLEAAEAYQEELNDSNSTHQMEEPLSQPNTDVSYPEVQVFNEYATPAIKKPSRFLRDRLENEGINIDEVISKKKNSLIKSSSDDENLANNDKDLSISTTIDYSEEDAPLELNSLH